MGDGVDEVRLAEPGAAAQKEWVVTWSAATCRTDGRGMGELVRGTNNEVREGVLRIEPLDRRRSGLYRRHTA